MESLPRSAAAAGRRTGHRWLSAGSALALALVSVCALRADEAIFSSGIVVDGQARPVHGLELKDRIARHGANGTLPEPFWAMNDGVRTYYLPARLTKVEQREELSSVPMFELPRTPRARSTTPDIIGSSTATPFDLDGRRTVTLKTARAPVPIVQEITSVRPDYLRVQGVTHEWTQGLDTRLLPPEILSNLIRRGSRPNNLDDRKAAIRLLLDARLFDQAGEELKRLMLEQPELKEWGEPQLPLIAEQKYRAAINEVQRRRRAGQHGLAFRLASLAPPEEVPADALLEVQEILTEYQAARENAGTVQMLLEHLEAELPPEQAERVRPLRPQLLAELHVENMARLEPFLRSEKDKGLSAEQKLAMAYSAWVVGPSFADVDLNVAINLWQARFLVLEYIRSGDNPLKREDYLGELKALEGVTIERLAELIPLLPYLFESELPAPGQPRTYDFKLADGLPARYAVALPAEYNPQHRYPAIVALRRSGMTLEETLAWWAGTAESPGYAMNRGYIVIAPEFAAPEADDYDYDVAAHRRVIASLQDARRKFSIDSDRVFLAGHQLGGDAVFDIATANPDVFAGAVPFVSKLDRYPRFVLANGAQFPWYVVTGERHVPGGTRDVEAHSRTLASLTTLVVRHKADVTYCEYIGRGFESYHEELPRLFDWMDVQRRKSLREMRDGWEVDVLRPTSTRFYWVEATELPDKLNAPINWAKGSGPGIKPMTFESKIGLENTMYVTIPAVNTAVRGSLWLSPTCFDFDKRLRVHVNNERKTRVNELIKPDPAALLEDFRVRGDRQLLFWAKVDL